MKYLYFHYGPGGNSDMESCWPGFSSQIELWNQPITSSYAELLDAAIQKSLEFRDKQGSLKIVAHSFGCDLALDVSRAVWADHIVLLAPIPSIPLAFLRLSKKIFERLEDDLVLKESLEKSICNFTEKNMDSFWALVSEVVRYEELNSLYWANEGFYNQYKSRVQSCRGLDFETWKKVLVSFLEYRNQCAANQIRESLLGQTSIDVIFGQKDPYFDELCDLVYWTEKIPQAKTKIVSAGHFPQFETKILFELLE